MFKKYFVAVFLSLFIVSNAHSIESLEDKLNAKLNESANDKSKIDNLIKTIVENGYVVKVGSPDVEVTAGERITLKIPITSGLTDQIIDNIASVANDLGGNMGQRGYPDISSGRNGSGFTISKENRLNQHFKNYMENTKILISGVEENGNFIVGCQTDKMNRIKYNGVKDAIFIVYPGDINYQIYMPDLKKEDVKRIKDFKAEFHANKKALANNIVWIGENKYPPCRIQDLSLTERTKMLKNGGKEATTSEDIFKKGMKGLFGK